MCAADAKADLHAERAVTILGVHLQLILSSLALLLCYCLIFRLN